MMVIGLLVMGSRLSRVGNSPLTGSTLPEAIEESTPRMDKAGPEHQSTECCNTFTQFMSLTPEIRTLIYEHVFNNDRNLCLPPPLTEVSRVIRAECLPVRFRDVTLDLRVDFWTAPHHPMASAATKRFPNQSASLKHRWTPGYGLGYGPEYGLEKDLGYKRNSVHDPRLDSLMTYLTSAEIAILNNTGFPVQYPIAKVILTLPESQILGHGPSIDFQVWGSLLSGNRRRRFTRHAVKVLHYLQDCYTDDESFTSLRETLQGERDLWMTKNFPLRYSYGLMEALLCHIRAFENIMCMLR